MDTANKIYRRKKRGIRWGRIVIIALVCAYIIMFVYTFFAQSIETTNIVYGKVEMVETVYGYITRNEQIVTSNLEGDLYPVMNEGERVSKGQAVAVVKNDNSDVISEKIKEITKKLNTFTTPGLFNKDIMLLDTEINEILEATALNDYNESFSSLKETKNKIETKLSKKSAIIGENSAKGSAERTYYEELKKYESQLTYSQQELVAPIAGTVAYKLDGYENVFSKKAISDYEWTTLEELNIPSGELVGSMKPNSFKIVDNIEGYITVVSGSEEAFNATVDKKVKLRFPEISQDEITGKVEFLSFEDDKAVITFRINRGIENLINYRKIKVDILWDNESGMKIPSKAIKFTDDGSKIFVVNGNRVIEKDVEVIANWNGEAIIEGKENNRVFLYDAIAVDAEKVNSKKIIISEK